MYYNTVLLHDLQYLFNIPHSLLFLENLSLSLDGMDYDRPVIQLLAFLLIVLGNFLQLQLCVTFHHLMQSLYKKQDSKIPIKYLFL